MKNTPKVGSKDLEGLPPMPLAPYRQTILDMIGDNFQSVIQWSGHADFGRCAKYSDKAEGLIELLEIHDCGSTGGFDEDQPTASNLFDRWDWLYRKYGQDPKGKSFGCNIASYEQIKEFYNGK